MTTEEFLNLKRTCIEKSFSKMNPDQREAIFESNRPLLILAGAGSGKTTVIVNRIFYLLTFGKAYSTTNDLEYITPSQIEILKQYSNRHDELFEDAKDILKQDVPKPWEILAITFTNKAAGELKERLNSMAGVNADDVWASTFHSFCSRILRRFADRIGYTSHFTIYDTDDSKRLLKKVMKSLEISDKVLPIKQVQSVISNNKDYLITPMEMLRQTESEHSWDSRKTQIAKIYVEYQKELLAANAMDFDDMILNTIKLFKENDDIRVKFQDQFKYIMVDEYQDTNRAQFVLIGLLCTEKNNICVVGDDDQSIYKFRGADIKNIMGFEKTFKNCHTVRLEQNYRSTQAILDSANAVIKNNTMRHQKALWTSQKGGDKIVKFEARDAHDEARFVCDKIEENVKNGGSFSDNAVLYRMNSCSNLFEQELTRRGIAYKIIGGFRFYERSEVKDMLSYLSCIANPDDNVRLMRIVNVPKRGIGAATVTAASEIADSLGESLINIFLDAYSYPKLQRCAKKLVDFAELILGLNQKSMSKRPDEIFSLLLSVVPYEEYLKEDKEKGEDRLLNIKELGTNLIEFSNENESAELSDFLDEVSLLSDIDNYNETEDKVTLMTLHSAKGLEFDNVFLPCMEEDIFPSSLSKNSEEEIEEERRLCYVGITRARKRLFVSCAQQRMLFGRTTRNLPSRFLGEIPKENIESFGNFIQSKFFPDSQMQRRFDPHATVRTHTDKVSDTKPDFHVGDAIKHKTFGEGVILNVEDMASDQLLTVAFNRFGIKKLMGKFLMKSGKI